MMHSPLLDFADIRPYTDEEVPGIIQSITQRPSFAPLMAHLYPNRPVSEVAAQMQEVKTVAQFQHTYISLAISHIIDDSISKLTYSGLEELNDKGPCLFVSNHRDIILDSGLLNVLRYRISQATTYIAIGDNLLISPMVTELMKLNKSFVVHRNPPRQQMYAYSERLSRYIRHLINEEMASVWIAQRSGRTKNGKDETQPSLLKMLAISGTDSFVETFGQLNIVPLCLSYEYEPCDYLKAEEQIAIASGEAYKKDDKLAIIKGIRDPKGRVHLAAGEPLPLADLAELDTIANRNERFRALGTLIDGHISRLYQRRPIHYVAADLHAGTEAHAAHYTQADKDGFEAYLDSRIALSKADPAAMRQMLYRIYGGMIDCG